MNPSHIKNIFWDVDGVLADLNHAYFHFLTEHPKYRDRYAGLKWEQLAEVLPIVPEYGALELKTYPELGAEMDRDFCADQDFFRNRPLYPGVNPLFPFLMWGVLRVFFPRVKKQIPSIPNS